MNKDSKEWRELEAYVTGKRAQIEKTLTLESTSDDDTKAKRIEYRLLGDLLTALGKPERVPVPSIDFGINHNE